jgi:hypothetical protein
MAPRAPRRTARYSSEDVQCAIFPDRAPKAKTLAQLKEGKKRYILKRAQKALKED